MKIQLKTSLFYGKVQSIWGRVDSVWYKLTKVSVPWCINTGISRVFWGKSAENKPIFPEVTIYLEPS